eukprot:scaffold151264_cov17-Prasinocladus_malaysianus.AAC.1
MYFDLSKSDLELEQVRNVGFVRLEAPLHHSPDLDNTGAALLIIGNYGGCSQTPQHARVIVPRGFVTAHHALRGGL